MQKRTAFIGAILSLLPLGQPLFIKSGIVLSTTGFLLSFSEKVSARNFDYYFDGAYDKAESGDHYGAISDYTKAIEINPLDDSAYHNRAVSREILKQCYKAIADYLRAIEIKSDRPKSYHGVGNCKSELGDFNGAISAYTKAIEINPSYQSA